MKKSTIAIATTIGLLLCACSNEGETVNQSVKTSNIVKEKTDKKTVSTETVEFSGVHFNIPTSFEEIERVEDSNVSYIVYRTEGNSSFNLVIEDLTSYGTLTLEQYVEMNTATTGYIYKSSKTYENNGYTWSELVSLDGMLQLHQTTVANDGIFYTFTFGAEPNKADEHLDTIEDILSSVVLP